MDCSNLKLRESSDSNVPIWILPAALALSYSTELQCVPYSMEILATSLFNLSICVSNMFNVRAASGNLNAVVFDHRSDVSNAYVWGTIHSCVSDMSKEPGEFIMED